jgi:hypothetical protein
MGSKDLVKPVGAPSLPGAYQDYIEPVSVPYNPMKMAYYEYVRSYSHGCWIAKGDSDKP